MPEQTIPMDARQFIMNGPNLPARADGDLVRRFIMETPLPPAWGPTMEQALRDALVGAGFSVRRCRCLEEHRVISLRLRGATELTLRQVKRRIREVAQDLGYSAPAGGMAITGRAGAFDGAFTVEPQFDSEQRQDTVF
jgi:hypothetical protein